MPDTLSAADFVSIRPQYKNEQADGELPAAVEHLFAQGTMIDHYFVRPAPALFEDQTFADFGRISAIVFCQQEGGAPGWYIFRSPPWSRICPSTCPMPSFVPCWPPRR